MITLGKSEAQRKLHKYIGEANLSGEIYQIVDRSGTPVAYLLSARDWEQLAQGGGDATGEEGSVLTEGE